MSTRKKYSVFVINSKDSEVWFCDVKAPNVQAARMAATERGARHICSVAEVLEVR